MSSDFINEILLWGCEPGHEVVTSKQIGDLFGFQPRTNSMLCKKWVEGGFLEIVDHSLKGRKYSLAKKYKKLL